MKPLFDDTSLEMERFLLKRYRQMLPAEKFRRVRDVNINDLLTRALEEAGLSSNPQRGEPTWKSYL